METGFSDIHPDVIQTHILPRLDGPTLATVSCVSAKLRSLSTTHHLWSQICNHTWPSIDTPYLRHVISTFPNGPLSFYALAFPLLHPSSPDLDRPSTTPPPDLLISAVDLFYKREPVLSKTVETETVTGWFRSAPLRIDLLDTKEVVPTPIANPGRDDTCQDLYRDLELSWILIDPTGRRAMNVSSVRPVSIHRHWLTGEVQARFATVMEGAGGGGEAVMCVVEVTCAGEEERELRVREVGFEVEDVEGMRLSGKESLEVVVRGMEWGRRVVERKEEEAVAEEEGGGWRRRKYEEFMERRRERKEMRKREEGKWDMVYVGVVVTGIVAFFVCFWTS